MNYLGGPRKVFINIRKVFITVRKEGQSQRERETKWKWLSESHQAPGHRRWTASISQKK